MVKYLVMDVDGTLTDGKIYMGNAELCRGAGQYCKVVT